MLKSERKVRIMTYTGAMVLPQNAIVMPEHEMRYVEGGKVVSKSTCQKLATAMAKVAFFSGVFAAAAAYCGQAIKALVAAILACGASYASYVFSLGASNKGLNVTKKGRSVRLS